MAVTKRAGRKARGEAKAAPPQKRGGGGGGVKKATFDIAKHKEVGVSDLTLLSKVSDEAINDNLQKRFQNGIIYTYIGNVLISVNPFRDLGIYTEEILETYRGKNRLEVSPHVFAVAEAMYYNMKAYKENQCVIISGESGAGKTEAAKRIMQYVAAVSGQSSSEIQKIKDMVLATNPLLESFGCAKTLRNDNSSRHGKYLEILFNQQAEPVGANITNYLLEKARVVGQIKNERNFHIFYQFTKGASAKQRELFGIQGPETYIYTSGSKCTEVQGIDDTSDFSETLKAMRTIGLQENEQDQIFKLLSAILWIGNIDFVPGDNDEDAKIRDGSVTNFVAYLLDVDAAALDKALTIRVVETFRGGGGRRGSVYESPNNCVQARAVRDALAKGIYNGLFDWIVDRVNTALKSAGGSSSAYANSIGILDIYGFEIFDNNSFEQICINYVNEKLQQIFIQLTLKTEQEEYVREQIEWTPIDYFNNKVVCDLIEERRPPGLFSVLNDACATAHADSEAADQNFAMKIGMLTSNKHFEQRQNKFVIKHYAGDVIYDIHGMTDKNKDKLSRDLDELLSGTNNQFLKSITADASTAAAEAQSSNGRRPRQTTASDKIKQSANALTETLSKCQPSYIRTIKPNQNRSPSEYDTKAVLHQVKYLGLKENVRIRRAGFAYRQTFEKFVERFYLLSGKTSYAGDYIWQGEHKTATVEIFKDTGIPRSEYQLGVTKVFIKTPETLFALEHMRDMYWHNMAARIQRAWRRYVRYKAEQATKIQRAWREYKGGRKYLQLRDKSQKLLGGRKERRRFSLLGYRKFMGDYLACNTGNSFGNFLLRSSGISGYVLFSARGQILHAKFGRSSQRVDRFFIMTSTTALNGSATSFPPAKTFYIIAEQLLNNKVSYVVERTISVAAIKQMSMSTLRDDCFAFSLTGSQEPEPLMWCVFKTELAALLGVSVHIADTIQYNKKPGKPSTVKFQKDSTVTKDDFYKSGTVHVSGGLPGSSALEPIPKPNPALSKPKAKITARPVKKATATATQAPVAKSTLSALQAPEPSRTPTNNGVSNGGSAAAAAAAAAMSKMSLTSNGHVNHKAPSSPTAHSSTRQAQSTPRAPPTAPTAPAAPVNTAPAKPMAKALYDFAAGSSEQLSLTTGEIVVVVEPEANGSGWFLAKKQDGSAEGWAPAAYVQEYKPPAPAAKKAAPPAPPKRKPKPAPAPPGGQSTAKANTATVSNGALASNLADALKKREEETTVFAGGLAAALKKNAGAFRSDDEPEDDDW